MRRVYARIALGVGIAGAAGWMAVALAVPPLRDMLEQDLLDPVLGSGLRWVGARLDATPREAWPERLAEARRELTLPLEIVSADALPPGVKRAVSAERPAMVTAGHAAPSIYIPLDGGSHFLVAGPLLRPPLGPFIYGALIFALVMTVTASAVVGIPLVRRLRRLRHAIGELGAGNWATRLDASAEGALGEVAESLNRMAGRLHRQFQEREALLQAVSHEMGTPLSRMRFQVELLEEEVDKTGPRNRLRALGADLDELDELSTELVGWMEADAAGEARQAFEVAPVLESLVELECHRRGDPIAVDLAVAPGLMVKADVRQFQRAIENLLRNAVRYAQHRIVVEARPAAPLVAVEVRDDGPGIPREEWTRVLEPFVRLEGPRSRAHRGLGLGLAIVRRIVEAHGGTVVVGEAVEGGTRIQTSWPSAVAAH